jgi:hypothetical protein
MGKVIEERGRTWKVMEIRGKAWKNMEGYSIHGNHGILDVRTLGDVTFV